MSLVVIASPREPFNAAEIMSLQRWVLGGGALLALAEQGGDACSGGGPTDGLTPYKHKICM